MSQAVVTVDAGICGFTTRIEAASRDDGLVALRIESDCPNIKGMANDLVEIDPMSVLVGKFKDGVIMACAARHPVHQACPVPVGIVKAVEVAAVLALPADATIKVERVDE